MQVTFLEGARKLRKSFHPDRVEAYPHVKTVTSHTYSVDKTHEGLYEKFELLQKHASVGHCMLKGSLTRPLRKESRAKMTDNNALSDNIVFDIDGLRYLPPPSNAFDATVVAELSEQVISLLPECFHNVSYIAHASASLGVNEGTTSIHLDFALKDPISSQMLKNYLTHLNFVLPKFEQQLDLTASGTALKYKLDRSLADNSRLIFIAPPKFTKVENPFSDDNDRLTYVMKPAAVVNLTEELDGVQIDKLKRVTHNKITALREMRNLPSRKEKTQQVRINGVATTIVTNPDDVDMQMSYENGPFVYYNINGGDSNAYYVRKDYPAVVYNFKGEPNFLFEQADPDSYQKHIEEFGFGENSSDDSPAAMPMVFRDLATNSFYQALYDPKEKVLAELHGGDRAACEDWMKQNEAMMPDPIPGLKFEFRPDDERTVDLANGFINRYVRSPLLRSPVEIPEKAKNTEYGFAQGALSALCPTLHKIIYSICGGGDLEYEHFINWLAYIITTHEKSMTAWVMHGVQGTGKGVFLQHVMMPILGSRHCTMKRTENLDEQFNDWMAQSLLVAIDEFNSNDTKSRTAIVNKLKNYITEQTISIRRMRTDQIELPNYCNFVFFSNDDAPVIIQENDRRHNVCPRQGMPLNKRYPDIDNDIRNYLPIEVPVFARFLLEFKVDMLQARRTLDNRAKEVMRDAGKSSTDEFTDAVKEGDLAYFLEVFDKDPTFTLTDMVLPAQNILKRILSRLIEQPNEPQTIMSSELRTFYNVLVNKIESDKAFGKLLGRRNVIAQRKTVQGRKKRCVDILWQTAEIDIPCLLEQLEVKTDPSLQLVKGSKL